MFTARVALPLATLLLLCALSVAQTDPCAEQIGSLQLQLEAKDSALARCGALVQELRVELAALRNALNEVPEGPLHSRRLLAPLAPGPTNTPVTQGPTVPLPGPPAGLYAFGVNNSNVCPAGFTPITTVTECATAAAVSQTVAATSGIATTTYRGVVPTSSGYPRGCFYYSSGTIMAVGVWFNPDAVGAARDSGQLLCKRPVCSGNMTVGGAEAVWPLLMGTYAKMAGLTQGDRPVYQLVGSTASTAAYLSYWPDSSAWRIGASYKSSYAPVSSAGTGALCPDLANGWLVFANGYWVSGYPIAFAFTRRTRADCHAH